jgi:hypothetical protein
MDCMHVRMKIIHENMFRITIHGHIHDIGCEHLNLALRVAKYSSFHSVFTRT